MCTGGVYYVGGHARTCHTHPDDDGISQTLARADYAAARREALAFAPGIRSAAKTAASVFQEVCVLAFWFRDVFFLCCCYVVVRCQSQQHIYTYFKHRHRDFAFAWHGGGRRGAHWANSDLSTMCTSAALSRCVHIYI